MSLEQVSPDSGSVLVIFGASGDLAKRKLFPSLYQLHQAKMLPEPFFILGYARTPIEREDYITRLKDLYNYSDTSFFDLIDYIHGQYDDHVSLARISTYLEKYSRNRLFYLSTPPSEVRNVFSGLKKAKLLTENSGGIKNKHTVAGSQPWTRAVLEKPFGEDEISAEKLNTFMSHMLTPDQVFVIDHFLGKEPIQNLLFFRFSNAIFENLWNSRYIDHIQISLCEDLRVEKRAGYFDQNGILKDMLQSHGLQMLALAMMEPPVSLDAEDVRKEKAKVLKALNKFSPAQVLTHVVRGQYDGYLSEEGVKEHSKTETFVALKTEVNNWRWKGIPVYLRTGKALNRKFTEIAICFREIPYNLFKEEALPLSSNRLLFRFQPETYIRLRTNIKIPGNTLSMTSSDLEFPYETRFKDIDFKNGYDRILYSSLINDASLFLSYPEVVEQWKFTDSILDVWNSNAQVPLFPYNQGSYGPNEMNTLFSDTKKQGWNED